MWEMFELYQEQWVSFRAYLGGFWSNWKHSEIWQTTMHSETIFNSPYPPIEFDKWNKWDENLRISMRTFIFNAVESVPLWASNIQQDK